MKNFTERGSVFWGPLTRQNLENLIFIKWILALGTIHSFTWWLIYNNHFLNLSTQCTPSIRFASGAYLRYLILKQRLLHTQYLALFGFTPVYIRLIHFLLFLLGLLDILYLEFLDEFVEFLFLDYFLLFGLKKPWFPFEIRSLRDEDVVNDIICNHHSRMRIRCHRLIIIHWIT